MRIEAFTGQIGTPEHEAWMIDCEAVSRAARTRFAQRQARLGRPVPRSPTDSRPDPGTLDGEDPEG
jgi:hypothetical protein